MLMIKKGQIIYIHEKMVKIEKKKPQLFVGVHLSVKSNQIKENFFK